MMGTKFGMGVVGTGMIGGFHAEAIEGLENAKLVAACDVVEERVQAFADKHGCKASCAEVRSIKIWPVSNLQSPARPHYD